MDTDAIDMTEDLDGGLAAVDLYWIPLGAGQHVVRLSGKLFEASSAWLQRRPRFALYHSALVVTVPESRFVVEQTPVIDAHGERRGVVVEGPVGSSLARRFRLLRYEVRRWRDGVIPDIAEAVSCVRVAHDLARAERVLDLVPSVPPLVWGRDEQHTGDMWNSNSVVSWLLARAGIEAASVSPPPGGRAPGWHAGISIAAHDGASTDVRSKAGADRSTSCLTSRSASEQIVHDGAIPSGGLGLQPRRDIRR